MIMAAAGIVGVWAARVDWPSLTANATAALLLAGTVGAGIASGIHFAVAKYDLIWLNRKKLYDEHNKGSLSSQVEELRKQAVATAAEQLENSKHMRESLHALRDEAQASKLEASESRQDLATLRQQFMAVSRQLHETDLALHAAHVELRATNAKLLEAIDKLAATEKDRTELRLEIESIRKRSHSHASRLKKLETGAPPEAAALAAVPAEAVDRNTAATNLNTEAILEASRDAQPPP